MWGVALEVLRVGMQEGAGCTAAVLGVVGSLQACAPALLLRMMCWSVHVRRACF